MNLYYCDNCKRIDSAKEILEEVCPRCNKIKKVSQKIMPVEYSDIDNRINNIIAHNMIFGTNENE